MVDGTHRFVLLIEEWSYDREVILQRSILFSKRIDRNCYLYKLRKLVGNTLLEVFNYDYMFSYFHRFLIPTFGELRSILYLSLVSLCIWKASRMSSHVVILYSLFNTVGNR